MTGNCAITVRSWLGNSVIWPWVGDVHGVCGDEESITAALDPHFVQFVREARIAELAVILKAGV